MSGGWTDPPLAAVRLARYLKAYSNAGSACALDAEDAGLIADALTANKEMLEEAYLIGRNDGLSAAAQAADALRASAEALEYAAMYACDGVAKILRDQARFAASALSDIEQDGES